MKVRSRTDREGQWTCSDTSVHQRHCSLLSVATVHMTNKWQLKSDLCNKQATIQMTQLL